MKGVGTRVDPRPRLLALARDLRATRARELDSASGERLHPEQAANDESTGVSVDDPFDTEWSHSDATLAGVVHLFHQEWHGIRAAAGYAPGVKVAVTTRRALTPVEQRTVVETLARPGTRAAILHGFSDNAEALLRLLRKELGPSFPILAVWHGSTAQFHFDNEVEGFERLLRLKRSGIVHRLACVKAGMHAISPEVFPRILLNFPPRVSELAGRGELSRTALVGMPVDWRKNFYTNLYAAAGSTRLRRVYTITDFRRVPAVEGETQIVARGRLSRRELLRAMRECDAVLYVTMSECQPMVALESMAVGAPCLTGPLGLDELDNHPYQRLAQVAVPDSIAGVRSALDRMLDLRLRSPGELGGMMSDYRKVLRAAAVERYAEFLGS